MLRRGFAQAVLRRMLWVNSIVSKEDMDAPEMTLIQRAPTKRTGLLCAIAAPTHWTALQLGLSYRHDHKQPYPAQPYNCRL
jgi:hypothetical protein